VLPVERVGVMVSVGPQGRKRTAMNERVKWLVYVAGVALVATAWDHLHGHVAHFLLFLPPVRAFALDGASSVSFVLAVFYLVRDLGYVLIVMEGFRFLREPLKRLGLTRFVWWHVPLGIAAAFAFDFAFEILRLYVPLHQSSVANWTAYHQGAARGLAAVLLVLIVGIISPIVQEIYFRGALIRAFNGVMPAIVSIVISSLLFGLWHHTGGTDQMAFAFLSGIVQAVLYVRTRSLTAPCAMHIAINLYALFFVMARY